jgi:DNA modification methylase
MRKEQLADNVTLYCGDCREVIAGMGFMPNTHVVSDPPYGIQDLVKIYGRTNHGGSRNLQIANDKNLDVVGEAFALLRSRLGDAWVAAFYSCRISPEFFQTFSKFEYFGEMIWDKKLPGLGLQIRYQHENVAWFKIGKPPQLNDCMSLFAYTALRRTEERTSDGMHPHEKPHQVMVNVLQAIPAKSVILDPFMGTGSTGAAAIELKHGFIGIELDPDYFYVACKKISAAINQPTAFWE